MPFTKADSDLYPGKSYDLFPGHTLEQGNDPSYTDNCQYCSDPYSHQTTCKYQSQENGHSNIKRSKQFFVNPTFL